MAPPFSAPALHLRHPARVSLTGTDLSPMPAGALAWATSGGITNGPAFLPGGWITAGGYLVGPRANLSNADLSGTNLTAATLTQAKVAGATFANADLSGLDLSGLGLNGSDFTGTNLTDVTISSSTNLTFVTLTSATLTGVDLSPASTNTLQGLRSGSITNGPEVLPNGWHLVDGYLIGAYADLSGANLTTAVLSGMDLSHTNLQDAALHGATVNGTRALAISGTPASLPTNWAVVNFNSAANLVGPGVDLSGANLAYADLSLVDLAGANLSNATLDYGVDLSGTVLLDANLTGIDTSPYAGTVGGVCGTPVDLPAGWVVANGYLVGPTARLVFANLAGQDLTGASLAGSDLRLADFSDATGRPPAARRPRTSRRPARTTPSPARAPASDRLRQLTRASGRTSRRPTIHDRSAPTHPRPRHRSSPTCCTRPVLGGQLQQVRAATAASYLVSWRRATIAAPTSGASAPKPTGTIRTPRTYSIVASRSSSALAASKNGSPNPRATDPATSASRRSRRTATAATARPTSAPVRCSTSSVLPRRRAGR